MACGPVDRRADRAEPARAGPGRPGPSKARTGRPVRTSPCGLGPPRAGLFTVGPPGWKKILNFKNECIDTQVVCLKFIYVFNYLREVISDFSEF